MKDVTYSMQVATEIPMNEWGDLEGGYITTFIAKILCITREEGSDEKTKQIGNVLFRILHVADVTSENDDLSDVCDSDSAEMHYLYCVYFSSYSDSLKDIPVDDGVDIDSIKEGHGGTDVLYLAEVVVSDDAFTNDVHVAAVHYILRTFGNGCDLAVIIPDGVIEDDVCKRLNFTQSKELPEIKCGLDPMIERDDVRIWHRKLCVDLPRIHIRDFASKFEFPSRDALMSCHREDS